VERRGDLLLLLSSGKLKGHALLDTGEDGKLDEARFANLVKQAAVLARLSGGFARVGFIDRVDFLGEIYFGVADRSGIRNVAPPLETGAQHCHTIQMCAFLMLLQQPSVLT